MSKKATHPRMITKSMQPFGVEPRAGDEYFANGIFEFNITMMNAYIDSHPEEFQKVKINVGRYEKTFRRSEINQQYVEDADINRPVILAEIAPDRLCHRYPTIDQDFYSRGYNLIDGHHRLHKARQMGHEEICAWILPMEQHCRFMFKGFEKYMEYWNDKLVSSNEDDSNCRGLERMNSHKVTITENDMTFETLEDILPLNNKRLRMLIIGKVPMPESVRLGHYFQGRQGRAFWNKLKEYAILRVPNNTFEDDVLLDHSFGIMDIVKSPRFYGNEPTIDEYKRGLNRITTAIQIHKPKVLLFVYKGVLDNMLRALNSTVTTNYGFNAELGSDFYNTRIFVFPMPGTHCRREIIDESMKELKMYLESLDYICPNPKRWHEIYKDLIQAYNKKYKIELPKTVSEIYAAGGPPTPLILGGWWESTIEEKQNRWLEILQWAKLHDLKSYTHVEEKDKCYYKDF